MTEQKNQDINNVDNVNDIDEIDEKPSTNTPQKTIIFCVPGKEFKSHFILNWTELLLKCVLNNYRPILCHESDRNIYIQRNKCLGADILTNSKTQKPFQEQVEYDYLVWIDPNVIFTFEDLKKLLNSKYKVTSGVYTFNQNITNVVQDFDYNHYKKNGIFNFLTHDDITVLTKEDNRYFEADFVDFGFVCMKRGVAERIQYPWFEPHTNEDEQVSLFTDSYAYCKKLEKEGIKIVVDTNTKMRYSEL